MKYFMAKLVSLNVREYFVEGCWWYNFVAGYAHLHDEVLSLASCQTPIQFPAKKGKRLLMYVFYLAIIPDSTSKKERKTKQKPGSIIFLSVIN